MDNYKSYSLFNDIEDVELKAQNRGRIMCNIVLDHMKDGKANMKGVAISTGYMREIPYAERRLALDAFIIEMRRNGYALTGSADNQVKAYEGAINVR